DELFPVLRLERLPLMFPPGPCCASEPCAVRHQMADGYVAHIAVWIMHGTQFRQVLDYRIIQLQQASVAKLHDRYAGEGLGDRSPVINGVFVYNSVLLLVFEAVEFFRNDLTILNQHEAASNDSMLLQFLFVECLE